MGNATYLDSYASRDFRYSLIIAHRFIRLLDDQDRNKSTRYLRISVGGRLLRLTGEVPISGPRREIDLAEDRAQRTDFSEITPIRTQKHPLTEVESAHNVNHGGKIACKQTS